MPTLEVSKMNPAQMMILESSADVKDENEVSDLMTVLRNFCITALWYDACQSGGYEVVPLQKEPTGTVYCSPIEFPWFR